MPLRTNDGFVKGLWGNVWDVWVFNVNDPVRLGFINGGGVELF